MSGLTAELRWFHSVFLGCTARTTLTFLHLKTVNQSASSRAELLDFKLFPHIRVLSIIIKASKLKKSNINHFDYSYPLQEYNKKKNFDLAGY